MKTGIDNDLFSARSTGRASGDARPPRRSSTAPAAPPHQPPRPSSSPPLAEESPVRDLIRRLEEITVDIDFNDQGRHQTRSTQGMFVRALRKLPIHPSDQAQRRRCSENSFGRRRRRAQTLHPFALAPAFLSGLSSSSSSAACSDCVE